MSWLDNYLLFIQLVDQNGDENVIASSLTVAIAGLWSACWRWRKNSLTGTWQYSLYEMGMSHHTTFSSK